MVVLYNFGCKLIVYIVEFDFTRLSCILVVRMKLIAPFLLILVDGKYMSHSTLKRLSILSTYYLDHIMYSFCQVDFDQS